MVVAHGSLPGDPRDPIPGEHLAPQGLYPSFLRWQVGLVVVRERQGLELFRRLVGPAEDDTRVSDVSHVQLPTFDDDDGSCGPGCTWETMAGSRPFI